MKLPTPEKLPSGAWRVRVLIDGRRISITKPTEAECIAEALAVKSGRKQATGPDKTLSQAIDNYIRSRENVLSASTIRGYRMIQKNRFQSLMSRRLSDLTANHWQKAVNTEAKLCSAKTLKNAWGLISSVIRDQTGDHITVRLPQVIRKDLPFLTAEQLPVFLDAIRGNHYEIPILLGLSSLRRSEILATRWRDIDLKNGCIHVRGAAVMDEHGDLIQQATNKNTSSRRTVPFLIPQLREAIIRTSPHDPDSMVTDCYPTTIKNTVDRICDRNGLPKVGAHGLRRSFASLMYHLGIPEEIAMRAGGWSDITTMRKIYTKISEADTAAAAADITKYFQTTKPAKRRHIVTSFVSIFMSNFRLHRQKRAYHGKTSTRKMLKKP